MKKYKIFSITNVILVVGSLYGMEPALSRRNLNQPSLIEFFGLEQLSELSKKYQLSKGICQDIQNNLAAHMVGPDGWWYKKLTLQHKDKVRGIAFHPKGKMIGTACDDHFAYLCDDEGNELRKVQYYYSVNSIAFHPSGKIIGTACDDYNADLLDCKGNPIRGLLHNNWVYGIAFHPQGTMIGTACADGKAYLWDDRGNKLKMLPHKSAVNGIAFHPNGKMIGTACADGNAYLWDCKGKELRRLPHNGGVYGVAFHPDGKMIGTVCRGSNAYLWDNEGNLLRRLPHKSAVNGIGFHQGGKIIGTVCGDGNAYLWQNYPKPTLKQVLFRQVLKNYFKECIACKQKPDNFAVEGANFIQKIRYRFFGAKSIASKTLVPWMARKFNLNETELNEVWQSFPPIMRVAIARTVLYRAGALACEDE